MTIRGLQKITLLDFPGKVACTVFLGGCNFRCPFCHNSSLVESADGRTVSEADFFDFLQKRKGLIDGVCVTGGEPMLTRGLDSFLRRIKNADFLVKLDTNGSFPEKSEAFIDARLVDYVAMDIKNSLQNYKKTVGASFIPIQPTDIKNSLQNDSTPELIQPTDTKNSLQNDPTPDPFQPTDTKNSLQKNSTSDLIQPTNTKNSLQNDSTPDPFQSIDIKNPENLKKNDIACDLEAIKKSAEILMKNKVDFEFRTTVVRELHEKADFEAIGKWLKGGEKYYLQYFKPSDDTIAKGLTAPTETEMNAFRAVLAAYIPNVKIR